MTDKNYFPYLSREDAIEEYKSLRSEILESQKQRISLLKYSMLLFVALFGFTISDNIIQPQEALILVIISIAPSLFSYSTRCRERRIAHFLSTYLRILSPWSVLSSGKIRDGLKLNFLQRTSTIIIAMMILLDVILLLLGFPKNGSHCFDFWIWAFAIAFSFVNIWIAFQVSKLKNYKVHFERELENLRSNISND